MIPAEFHSAVLSWFDQSGRKHLPWQQDPTPYGIWVSEIMLQQTQVTTVIPYFLRFVARFPKLCDLAQAKSQDVMQLWAGLGYYARARNLHAAARRILEQYAGELPRDLDRLLSLPGIGRSTAGAILSMAFGIRAPILDGNVKRLLTRCAGIEGWPGDPKVSKSLWALSEHLTPYDRVGAYTQAMMDLGATVCTKGKPLCGQCPVQAHCQALASGRVRQLPTPKPRKNLPTKTCWMLALQTDDDCFYLVHRPPIGIWGGLWSLPEFTDWQDLQHWCQIHHIEPASLEALPQRRHTFTHYHLNFTPLHGRLQNFTRIESGTAGDWYRIDQQAALPAPIEKLLRQLQDNIQLRGIR